MIRRPGLGSRDLLTDPTPGFVTLKSKLSRLLSFLKLHKSKHTDEHTCIRPFSTMPGHIDQRQSNPSASHDHSGTFKNQGSSGKLSTSSDTDAHDLVAHLLRVPPPVQNLQDILDADANTGGQLDDFNMQALREEIHGIRGTMPVSTQPLEQSSTPPTLPLPTLAPRIMANTTYSPLGRSCCTAGQTDANPSHALPARPAVGTDSKSSDPRFNQTRTASRRTLKIPQLPVRTPAPVQNDPSPLARLSPAHVPDVPTSNDAPDDLDAPFIIDDASPRGRDASPRPVLAVHVHAPAGPSSPQATKRRALSERERRFVERVWRNAEKVRKEVDRAEKEATRPARLAQDIKELALLFESARDTGFVRDVTPIGHVAPTATEASSGGAWWSNAEMNGSSAELGKVLFPKAAVSGWMPTWLKACDPWRHV